MTALLRFSSTASPEHTPDTAGLLGDPGHPGRGTEHRAQRVDHD